MFSLGIDFGTSGARAIVLSASSDQPITSQCDGSTSPCQIVAQVSYQFSDKLPYQFSDKLPYGCPPEPWDTSVTTVWNRTLYALIYAIAPEIRAQIGRIAINGTSATMLLCDNQPGSHLTTPLMYNDTSARSALAEVKSLAPPESPAVSATSTFTKALWLYRQNPLRFHAADHRGLYITHQSDWLARLLHRQRPVTDYHNALKLGYDVEALAYPDWLLNSPIASWLPEVLEPGEAIAPIHPDVSKNTGIPLTCQICAGTTDSIAAFLASGAHSPGEAVTSLGSTLVLKLLSTQPINHQESGVYSHRLGDLWLAGGASNTGGAVLKQFFTSEQLAALSQLIDISIPCPYEYYPLTAPGERFPMNDPDYLPKLTPRPEADTDFLHGLLDSMARIEAQGYQKLNDLGAENLEQVYTAGGGAKNQAWQSLRQKRLGVSVSEANQTEAAYGTAQLAMFGLSRFILI